MLKRQAPLQSRARLRRRKRLPRVNPARRAAEFARCYGSVERVEWVKRQPCLTCGRTPSENAHIRTDGMGRKADARFIVPMCHEHHTELHLIGIGNPAWWQRKADATEVRWQAHVRSLSDPRTP